jgi:hypothetical protein
VKMAAFRALLPIVALAMYSLAVVAVAEFGDKSQVSVIRGDPDNRSIPMLVQGMPLHIGEVVAEPVSSTMPLLKPVDVVDEPNIERDEDVLPVIRSSSWIWIIVGTEVPAASLSVLEPQHLLQDEIRREMMRIVEELDQGPPLRSHLDGGDSGMRTVETRSEGRFVLDGPSEQVLD